MSIRRPLNGNLEIKLANRWRSFCGVLLFCSLSFLAGASPNVRVTVVVALTFWIESSVANDKPVCALHFKLTVSCTVSRHKEQRTLQGTFYHLLVGGCPPRKL
jgi:hypothetical protein